ncbi:hypothetical protein [Allokutzneria sp. NRRL B-24872]|uniref:hypothetical protein n=1 Tax=Allokutzneria sp. NRRL B-24872 TaxID=1137961 RepID=UPI000A380628|nr:hypothetical protein [Allokutzneria sp. NRRL B-24872]
MTTHRKTVALVVPEGSTADATQRLVTVIENIAELSCHVIPFGADLHATLAGAAVVLVVNARPHHVRAVRDLVEVPVLTEQDTLAAALTANVLTLLLQQGRAPQTGRVVVAGADQLPILCPVLTAAGIADITAWNRDDAMGFPLRRIAVNAHVIVDLLDPRADDVPPEPAVITSATGREELLALPGLLRALSEVPGARVDVPVHHACALALVMATPPELYLPAGPDVRLAERVAAAASWVLRRRTGHPC